MTRKASRIISSLYLQHFPQYPRSPQQYFLLHHSNIYIIPSSSIHLSNSFVTLPGARITTDSTSTIRVSTIFQSLSSSPGTFLLLSFLFSLLLHQLVQQYPSLSPFAISCQIQLCLVFLPLSHCHTEH